MSSGWTCFTVTFIVLGIIGIVTHRFFIKNKRVGIYLFLLLGSLVCPYGSIVWEILPVHENVNWLHKLWGCLGLLSGGYCIIMLVLFIRLDIKSLYAKPNLVSSSKTTPKSDAE